MPDPSLFIDRQDYIVGNLVPDPRPTVRRNDERLHRHERPRWPSQAHPVWPRGGSTSTLILCTPAFSGLRSSMQAAYHLSQCASLNDGSQIDRDDTGALASGMAHITHTPTYLEVVSKL